MQAKCCSQAEFRHFFAWMTGQCWLAGLVSVRMRSKEENQIFHAMGTRGSGE